ncbi:MAG: hypothetical protein RJA57_1412 [Bacteroidota bacterium]|jgi:AcrR family transcriptional regulator
MDPRARIVEKANERFMQFGIRSVSMDDIATALGMSKKTLYQHFADKDELVAAVVDTHIIEMQADCDRCRSEARDAVHEIFNTMKVLHREFSNMNPVVLSDLEKFHIHAWQRFREHKEGFLLGVIRANLVWGMREGLYRPDLNVDLLSRYRLESMMLPFNITVFPPGRHSLADTLNLLLELFIYGVASPKGYQLIQAYHDQQKNPTHVTS